MRSRRRSLPGLLCAHVVLLACGSDPTGPAGGSQPTFVTITSEPGDPLGRGGSFHYTLANAVIGVTRVGNRVLVQVAGDEGWNGGFAGPGALAPLAPGDYVGHPETFVSGDPALAGMFWDGSSACGFADKSFSVERIEFAGQEVALLDLTFRHECAGAPGGLEGRIHWDASDPTAPEGPQDPPPPGLWTPSTSLPQSGSFVYVESDPGDFIAEGGTFLSIGDDVRATMIARSLSIFVSESPLNWVGMFVPGVAVERLAPGYYADVRKWGSHNPTRGGLSWGGRGRGCTTARGWFVVDEVVFSGADLDRVRLRFEQHCDGSSAALRGLVHWQRSTG